MDADAAARTQARLRLIAYAIRERLGQREPTIVRVLAAKPRPILKRAPSDRAPRHDRTPRRRKSK